MRVASHQTPPAVRYSVGRTRLLGVALLALAAAGWVLLALWAVQGAGGLPWRVALAGVLCLACNACALHFWRRLPRGVLHWDGQHWCFENRSAGRGQGRGPGAAPTEDAPEVLLDLQNHLALRWRSALGRSRWLWLTRASDPACWPDLRRAVHARTLALGALPGTDTASADNARDASQDEARPA